MTSRLLTGTPEGEAAARERADRILAEIRAAGTVSAANWPRLEQLLAAMPSSPAWLRLRFLQDVATRGDAVFPPRGRQPSLLDDDRAGGTVLDCPCGGRTAPATWRHRHGRRVAEADCQTCGRLVGAWQTGGSPTFPTAV